MVIGDLLRLPSLNDLPLPWRVRTPLGLLSETSVYVTLVEGRVAGDRRRPPEIVVSVLDPQKWGRMLTVELLAPDQPGVIQDALVMISEFGQIVGRHNIALSESATVDAGDRHRITLVCEPLDTPQTRTEREDVRAKRMKKLEARLHKLLEEKMWEQAGNTPNAVNVSVKSLFERVPTIIRTESGRVENGWIRHITHMKPQIDVWGKEGGREKSDLLKKFDLQHAVVTADTDGRLLRYVFPRKRARALEIEHDDKPDQYLAIMKVLRNKKLNVLSGLLRRGGAGAKRASYVAVCEPEEKAAVRWEDDVRKAIEGRLLSARVKVIPVRQAAATTRFSSRNTISVPIPEHLISRIEKLWAEARAWHDGFKERVRKRRDGCYERVEKSLINLLTAVFDDSHHHIRGMSKNLDKLRPAFAALLDALTATRRGTTASAPRTDATVGELLGILVEQVSRAFGPSAEMGGDVDGDHRKQLAVFRDIRRRCRRLTRHRRRITELELLAEEPLIRVFISRRFVDDVYNRKIVRTLLKALKQNGAYPLHAKPGGSLLGDYTINQEVNGRVWAADAGVVIMTSTPGQRDNIGQNIPHEFGVLIGQGKPVCLLAEEGVNAWANLQGVYLPHFPTHEIAHNATVRGSIFDLIRKFVASVRESRRIRDLGP